MSPTTNRAFIFLLFDVIPSDVERSALLIVPESRNLLFF